KRRRFVRSVARVERPATRRRWRDQRRAPARSPKLSGNRPLAAARPEENDKQPHPAVTLPPPAKMFQRGGERMAPTRSWSKAGSISFSIHAGKLWFRFRIEFRCRSQRQFGLRDATVTGASSDPGTKPVQIKINYRRGV